MERRNFLRTMLGVAAATALPSEVWPFRKIFLPPVGPHKFSYLFVTRNGFISAPSPFVEVSREELDRTLAQFKTGIGYLVIDEPPEWFNLSRSHAIITVHGPMRVPVYVD